MFWEKYLFIKKNFTGIFFLNYKAEKTLIVICNKFNIEDVSEKN